MGLILDLITLLAAIIAYGLLEAAAIAGGLFLLYKKLGPSDEFGAYEFDTSDKRALQEFAVRCMLHALMAVGAALIAGFLLNKIGPYFFNRQRFLLGVILLVIHTAAVFVPARPLHKIDTRRAAMLTAFPTVLFLIFYPWLLASLIR